MENQIVESYVIPLLINLVKAGVGVICLYEILLARKSTTKTTQETPKVQPWTLGEKVEWGAQFVYLKAPYENAKILNQAKLLVDKVHPLRFGPHGLGFISLRHREYYLNQYLWFYEENGRFPRREILKDKVPFKGFGWVGSPNGYEPHQWVLPPSYVPNNYLKKWREKLGISRELASVALGISRSTIAKYERATEIPCHIELACKQILFEEEAKYVSNDSTTINGFVDFASGFRFTNLQQKYKISRKNLQAKN